MEIITNTYIQCTHLAFIFVSHLVYNVRGDCLLPLQGIFVMYKKFQFTVGLSMLGIYLAYIHTLSKSFDFIFKIATD